MDEVRLETERLVLRTPRPQDAARVLEYFTRNREHFEAWDPLRSAAFYTPAFWRSQIRMLREELKAGRVLPLYLSARGDEEGPLLGHATFSNIVRGPLQAATLGYALDADAVGRGYMFEALRAAIAYCFDRLGLHRVQANHMPRNARSAGLLRRLGFEQEGLAKDYLRIAGRWEDHVLTSITNPAWRPED